MGDDDLKKEVQELKQELEKQKEKERKKERSDAFDVFFTMAVLAGIGIWLFNGGFGQVARFLFWFGIFQHK